MERMSATLTVFFRSPSKPHMLSRKLLQILGRLQWLRFGVRDRIIRFFHNPDTTAPEPFEVDFFGARYAGNFDSFLDWSVFYYGAYTGEELRLMEDLLGIFDKSVVMDVGANIGHHTLFAAMRAKRVLAFEPFSEVSDKLKQKVRANKLDNVTLFEFALGERNEHLSYVKPGGHNSGTGSFAEPANGKQTVTLPVRVGDEVLSELGVEQVHFIKIDTEGFEPFVLKGLKQTLARCRPVVFFEWTQNERLGNDVTASALFPPSYVFYEFVSDTVRFGLFRSARYRLELVPPGNRWPDGNLLAVPEEAIARLQTTIPLSGAPSRVQ
jgi:FkbM family methyltransferase